MEAASFEQEEPKQEPVHQERLLGFIEELKKQVQQDTASPIAIVYIDGDGDLATYFAVKDMQGAFQLQGMLNGLMTALAVNVITGPGDAS